MIRHREQLIVVGGGIGGLVAAIEAARADLAVTLLERAPTVGGKMSTTSVEGRAIDAGPTVLTMRWVFEELFAACGLRLEDFVTLQPAEVLARHRWIDTPDRALDLFGDVERSRDAIGDFAGAREARGFINFCAHARRIYDAVEEPFLRASKPSIGTAMLLARRLGFSLFSRIDAHRTLARSLEDFFHDPRLIQLFGRYATYAGSSPYLAPGTLAVIAHVEREGVWLVDGGMSALARALAEVAKGVGVRIRTGASVEQLLIERGAVTGVRLESGEEIHASSIVFNGDPAALATGKLGARARVAGKLPDSPGLSAVTTAMVAKPVGAELSYHNVFFANDYRREFDEIFSHGRVPSEPTVYLCAQDRAGLSHLTPPEREALFLLINAPPNGDAHVYSSAEKQSCLNRTLDVLARCGVTLERPSQPTVTTPTDFAARFPGTGGALYGGASHGMTSAFARLGARTKIQGLYLTGGGVHPGAGLPMALSSGRLAAKALIEDLASTSRSRKMVMRGGTSMS